MDKKNKKDLTKDELATEFVKTLGNLEQTDEVEKMIADNVIEFELKDVKYHVRQLTFEENGGLEKFRRTKYLEFLDDKTMKFQKQWIKLYKDKGIDILGMEQKIRDNIQKENQLMIKLATTADKDRVEELKAEIIAIRTESATINIEKVDYLSYSIEDQMMISVNSYFTFLVLETLKDKEWKRVYSSFDEFNKSKNSTLLTKAFQYVNSIIYSNGV